MKIGTAELAAGASKSADQAVFDTPPRGAITRYFEMHHSERTALLPRDLSSRETQARGCTLDFELIVEALDEGKPRLLLRTLVLLGNRIAVISWL